MNIESFIPLAAAFIYITLLSALLAYRPWRRRHKVFAWFLIGALLWSVSNVLFRSDYLSDQKLLLAKFTICSFTFMLVPFCYFVTTFYERPRDNWLPLAWVPFASSIVLAILGYLPESVQTSPAIYPQYNLTTLLIFIALPLFILGGRAFFNLSRRLILAENPVLHNQTIYLLITITILTLSGASNFFIVGRQLPLGHIGNLAVALLLAYATLKHQLVDIKIVLRGGLVYGGITVFTTISYLLLLYLFQQWFHSEFGLPTVAIAITLAVGLACVLYPLRNVLQKGVDHLFYPATYDYRKTLLDFTRKASSILDINELSRELTTLVGGAVSARRASLLLTDSGDGDLTTRFVSPDGTDEVPLLKLRKDSPIIEWLRKENKPLFRETLDILPEFTSLWKEEKSAIASSDVELFAPLVSRGNLVGVLVLGKKEPLAPYDLGDIELVRALTHETAIAIENAQLHARIETQAVTDGLTHLFNRRHFDVRLREEIGRESRQGGNFSLILIDIDGFKIFNDTQGHVAGDELLAELGEIIKESVRGIDMAFRYGGDEFALLLPGTPAEGAAVVAERVCKSVQRQTQAKAVPVTASLGIACWPDDGVTNMEIVRAADRALYQAKRNGGNQAVPFSHAAVAGATGPDLEAGTDKEALGIIYALAAAVEAKDTHTYGHSVKVAGCCVALAGVLGMSSEEISSINAAAMLHDIGKIGIPDGVLQKVGPLESGEWRAIRAHPRVGATIVGHVSSLAGCIPAILYHHERYDGTGYPEGLKGASIPVQARIMAIADAFAAMTSARPYRDAIPYDKVAEELNRCAGSQFDPNLVQLFLTVYRSVPT